MRPNVDARTTAYIISLAIKFAPWVIGLVGLIGILSRLSRIARLLEQIRDNGGALAQPGEKPKRTTIPGLND